ncbi:3-oxoacyl-ACP reductase FabG [Massilia sp. YMA4]|uniref:3-oxoacyl-ACP reductase FabG n=1 Tax=[Empedobacter] haloabium TaxID=592317 RepID=A0ABZ1UNN4_9BURK|nr:3-oxoacyl-ACP reductase FabG [Massilia sp. YMA4]AXA92287.1 3-oxoacyl-ACP reductase FabG [Massilia sp. YMA4]
MSNPVRKILVTGASRGIGRAIAVRLAADGFHVVCHYGSDQQGALATLGLIGGERQRDLLCFDVSDGDATRAVLDEHIERHGAFWGVVANAGMRADAVFAGMARTDWQRVLDVNLSGFFNVVQPLVQPMLRLRDGGRILGVSSLSSSVGVPGQANYSASKAGMEAAARALAVELARRRITVNCLLPGYIATDMLGAADLEALAERVPLRRLGQPDEVAALAGFLCGEAAGYITKQSIRIDGGIG